MYSHMSRRGAAEREERRRECNSTLWPRTRVELADRCIGSGRPTAARPSARDTAAAGMGEGLEDVAMLRRAGED